MDSIPRRFADNFESNFLPGDKIRIYGRGFQSGIDGLYPFGAVSSLMSSDL
jgi:hypothetical protein